MQSDIYHVQKCPNKDGLFCPKQVIMRLFLDFLMFVLASQHVLIS